MTEFDAPDLVEPILGWRLWRLSGGLLVSIGKGFRTWDATERAVCVSHRHHPAPCGPCECGLYAHHAAAQAVAMARLYRQADPLGMLDLALGAVELWGAVEVYREGVRAEHARIVGLALPGEGVPGRFLLVTRAARHYGVPALPLPELTAYASAGRGRVPERLMPPPPPPPPPSPPPPMSSPAWPFISGTGAVTCLVAALETSRPILAAGYVVSTALWCGACALQVAARRRLR